MHIIDRRLNPGGKSLANRQRFLRRAKALVRNAVRSDSRDRDIKDIDQGGEISIPLRGVREPQLRRSAEGGVREHVAPGNKEFLEGDEILKPDGGGGLSSEGSPDGDGEDEFRFALSPDEYLDLFLEDLARVEREGGDEGRLAELREELARASRRIRRIPYIDPIDLRYRQFAPYPKPVAQAVMFC